MKPQGHFKERRQKGLSLEAFAGAKKSTYDKIAKDNKAFNLNAKKVNTYRKWLAKEGSASAKGGIPTDTFFDTPRSNDDHEGRASEATAPNERGQRDKKGQDKGKGRERYKEVPKKYKTSLQRLQEKVAAEKLVEEEEKDKERLEAEERGRQKEAAQAARKKKTELMRKKTRKGQPVMKNRIEDLLSKIEAGMKAGR
eukprot:CAMPEP_0198209118 /NCGR_PEP_ID=MMETSP1445-20131203/12424_1 /TAXON_ID=36898 /ORGANISM="Pyramimonas sp., Strain CCMP2087" /LENGTH=196 /DNA_ID=CAMNT_0043882759 /DNA_START=135 /DNA_END=725 /DNA_ORIENTATION=+